MGGQSQLEVVHLETVAPWFWDAFKLLLDLKSQG